MLADIQSGIHSDCSGPLRQVCYSPGQFPACADLHGYFSLWVETFIFFISNIMRLQLVCFCILLWSFWIEIQPFGMSLNFLPNVASSINLLRVYSVSSSRLLIKILNNISSSIDPRVLCYLCQMNIKLSITVL